MAVPIAGFTQEEWDKIVGGAKAGLDQLAQTGTFNGSTPNQNLAAVANQPGNTSGTKATPYIKADGTTDYHITGGSYVAPPPPPVNNAPTQTSAPTISTATSGDPSNGLSDAQSYIEKLMAAQKTAAIANLTKSRDAALSNLSSEKASIQPKFYSAKNQVAAGGQQNSRNFAEYMAARGGASSGSNAQAEISNNMTTQSGVNDLTGQETAAYTDIDRRTTGVNNAFESDKVSAEANIEATRMKALLDDYYAAQSRGDTLAQNSILNKLQESQLKLQQSNQDFNQNLQTNQYNQDVNNTNFNQNLQTKQLERGNFESDRAYNLAKANQDWTQTFQKEQFTEQKAQQLWDNTFQDKNFTQSMKEAAASRGLQWAGLNQRDKEFVADQAFREKSYTADQEQRKTDNAYRETQTKWDNNPLNPKNLSSGSSGSFNLDDYKGFINQNYYNDVLANPTISGDKTTKKQLDAQAAERYILSQPNLTNDQKTQMYNFYGIPMK